MQYFFIFHYCFLSGQKGMLSEREICWEQRKQNKTEQKMKIELCVNNDEQDNDHASWLVDDSKT